MGQQHLLGVDQELRVSDADEVINVECNDGDPVPFPVHVDTWVGVSGIGT